MASTTTKSLRSPSSIETNPVRRRVRGNLGRSQVFFLERFLKKILGTCSCSVEGGRRKSETMTYDQERTLKSKVQKKDHIQFRPVHTRSTSLHTQRSAGIGHHVAVCRSSHVAARSSFFACAKCEGNGIEEGDYPSGDLRLRRVLVYCTSHRWLETRQIDI